MNPRQLEELLRQVAVGRLNVPAALARLRNFPSEDLGDAVLDHHRALRCGHAEVVLAQGKTPAQVLRIAGGILAAGSNLLITRVEAALGKSLKRAHRAGQWHPQGRLFCLQQHAPEPGLGTVLVISAGTSDQSVAEEAALTLEFMGNSVERLHDVGVAGVHRLLVHAARLRQARALVVVAGMEGALASVVGGLTDRPVIAVPTSVGYGANLGGLTALFAMLNSCASGVTVVNIDNGFGAGFAASLINHAPGARAETESTPRPVPAARKKSPGRASARSPR